MTRLEQTIEDLRIEGYEFSSLKQLSGGINSAVYEGQSNYGVKYIIKLYPLPTRDDLRNRCQTEKNFLNYLQTCQIHNTPSLLTSNMSRGWSLMSWINGKKPTNLQESDISEITEFISSINKASTEVARSQMLPASEAYQSLPELITMIEERIKKLKSTNSSSEIAQKTIRWVNNELEPRFKLISEKLLNTYANSKHWKNLHTSRIASPSDVGVHNTLRTQQGLYFLDFEYAGLDDLAKFLADWVLQPEYVLSATQESYFLDSIGNSLGNEIPDSWRYRYSHIKPMIFLKWCLIMLNPIIKHEINLERFNKVQHYFNSNIELLAQW